MEKKTNIEIITAYNNATQTLTVKIFGAKYKHEGIKSDRKEIDRAIAKTLVSHYKRIYSELGGEEEI